MKALENISKYLKWFGLMMFILAAVAPILGLISTLQSSLFLVTGLIGVVTPFLSDYLIHARFGRRKLSPKQVMQITSHLRDVPKVRVSITAPMGDLEATRFAENLAVVLINSGFPEFKVAKTTPFKCIGSQIWIRELQNASALAIRDCFQKHGIKLKLVAEGSLVDDDIHIFIGPKFDDYE